MVRGDGDEGDGHLLSGGEREVVSGLVRDVGQGRSEGVGMAMLPGLAQRPPSRGGRFEGALAVSYPCTGI